ncbi:metal-dependent hydrolase [Paraflavitalea sp. CAU 1676]|uniref:metal-dependent hydrolase n=1 Tax=Paraflavitalea sp. CAU 1676 TaxID=3032598 RepID=UPI0023DC7CE9|nr:metal-dependent hydrolase [Paraflavitalea sp. CAU 1676]MDF2189504.1 metal-dependent hydrolase [Paraflavitalea sp. CAU 1676]
MKLTYYGHSCFSVSVKGKKLLFDPFITYNELANNVVDVDQVEADYILVSHGHADHIADCVRIAARTGAQVIATWEVGEWLMKQGITNVHQMNTGGKWNFGDFMVKCVVAQHSSGLPDGSYGGNPMGFIVYTDEGNFYYSGDTALTLDMQLIPRWAKLNFAVLPIGDNFTMDATDAAECARMVQCDKVVGVHYDTFGFIRIDHQQAVKAFADAGAALQLVKIGDTIDL